MMEEKLPTGWVQSKVSGFMCEVKEKVNPIEINETIYIGLEHFGSARGVISFGSSKEVKSLKTVFKKGDVLYGKLRPYLNKHDVANYDGICSTDILVFRNPNEESAKFFNYYLSLNSTISQAHEDSSGINLPRISSKKLGEFNIPIPPLSEQQRIVAKLDALFGHLDRLREKLEGIPALLKNFRQQVLTQAVTGELTKEWREGKGLGEWEVKTLEELIVEKPRNGYSPKGVEYKTDVKSLTLSATTKGFFDPSHIKYLDIEKPDKASHLWLKKGDILIQRSNSLEYVGTAAIYDSNDDEFIYPDLIMKLRANQYVETNYLFFVLSSNQTKDYFKKNATGTAGNMPKINQGTVMNTPVPYPSLNEQKEIASRVDVLFSFADKIESQFVSLKANMDQLPQGILAKAFRGELVDQEVEQYVVEEREGLMAAEPDSKNLYS